MEPKNYRLPDVLRYHRQRIIAHINYMQLCHLIQPIWKCNDLVVRQIKFAQVLDPSKPGRDGGQPILTEIEHSK